MRKKPWVWTVGVVGIAGAFFLGAPKMATGCGQIGSHAMDRLRQCPKAVELLGDDIDVAYGVACGSYEAEGASERANWRIPVSGSRARGTYAYSGDRIGSQLRFAGQLTVGEVVIDIGSCLPTPEAPPES